MMFDLFSLACNTKQRMEIQLPSPNLKLTHQKYHDTLTRRVADRIRAGVLGQVDTLGRVFESIEPDVKGRE